MTTRRLGQLWAFAGGAVLAIAGVFPLNNSDGYGHLAQGRDIAERGYVPKLDPFSFWKAEPQPWQNYEWAYDLLSYWVYDALGPNGLLAAKCLVLFLIGVVLVRTTARLAGAPEAGWLTTVVLALGAPAARFRLTERPHLLGIFFAAVLLAALLHLARGTAKRPWAWVAGLALMHIVWVNCHGSHLLGVVVTGAYAVFALPNRPVFVRLASLAALQVAVSGISPFGYGILEDAIAHVVKPEYRAAVTEWGGWTEGDSFGFPITLFAHTALLIAGIRALFRRGHAERAALAVALLMAFMAVRSVRFIGEYLLLSAPALAAGLWPHLTVWWAAAHRAVAPFALACACGAAAWATRYFPPDVRWGIGESAFALPEASGDFLRAHVRAPRVLAPLPESWYLMWRTPGAKFLVDGRAPFYGADYVLWLSAQLAKEDTMRRVVDRFGVDTMVFDFTSPGWHPTVEIARRWPDWSVVFLEDRHVVFVRKDRLGGDVSPLEVLGPVYDWAPVVARDADVAAIWRDLARLGDGRNGAGLRAWAKGLLALRPLFREGALAGVRAPVSAAERAAAVEAEHLLARAAVALPNLPMVEIPLAMARLALCDLDGAREARERAMHDVFGQERRETLLLAQEISLRAGDTEPVRAFLAEALAADGVREDPSLSRWLPAIEADLNAGVRCPAAASQ